MQAHAPVIAVLIPCRNESQSVARVVEDFRRVLPDAVVFVYDNASTDDTFSRARAAGAVARRELLPGKGNVVRRMFADVEADVYIMVDGDGTYEATAAPLLVARLWSEALDMVSAARVETSVAAYRRGHRLGNRLMTAAVSWLFGRSLGDMLTGYRVMSRRFVKSFPALSSGFEIETELTVHALQLRLPIAEVPTQYGDREVGSTSKLNTWRDGLRILSTIARLFKEEKPLEFFSGLAAVLAAASFFLGLPLIATFLETGLVPRLPTAVLAMGLMLAALLTLACGIILQTVTRGRAEVKRLHYLGIPIRSPRRSPTRDLPLSHDALADLPRAN
jgi:glycosyltransferase involved in cell wall biosynthesis